MVKDFELIKNKRLSTLFLKKHIPGNASCPYSICVMKLLRKKSIHDEIKRRNEEIIRKTM